MSHSAQDDELDEVERECQILLSALDMPSPSLSANDPEIRSRSVSDEQPQQSLTPEEKPINSEHDTDSKKSTPEVDHDVVRPSPDRWDHDAFEQLEHQERNRRHPTLDPHVLAALPVTPGKLVTLSTGERIDPCTLNLRDVDSTLTDEDLKTYFSRFGDVLFARVDQRHPGSYYGVVTMSDPHQALTAKLSTHRKFLGHTLCVVEFSKSDTERQVRQIGMGPSLVDSRHPPSATVWVDPILKSWSDNKVCSLFSQYEHVLNVRRRTQPHGSHDFAFITMSTIEEAGDVIKALHGTPSVNSSSRLFFVEFASPLRDPCLQSRLAMVNNDTSPYGSFDTKRRASNASLFSSGSSSAATISPESSTLFVEPIYNRPSESALADRFAPYGHVLTARLRQKTETRGYAFVEMSSLAEANRAIAALDRSTIREGTGYGETLTVMLARHPREGGGGDERASKKRRRR